MAQIENNLSAKTVNSKEDIVKVFEELKKKYSSSLSEKDFEDLMEKVNYFFDTANYPRHTPSFNNHFINPNYGEKNKMYNQIVTVPKEKNNYYLYQKGTFTPVCAFSYIDVEKTTENSYLISIDFKNKAVQVNKIHKKLVLGSEQKVVSAKCICVSNLIIPNSSELIRGKIKDIENHGSKVIDLGKPSSSISHNDIIAMSILPISRTDFDLVHENKFGDVGNLNEEQSTILNSYFKQNANPPHLHFIYKDYVLKHKMTDSSALALNVNDLTRYLVDLNAANSNDSIAKYNFGMPFVDIKKAYTKLSGKDVMRMSLGFSELYGRLQKQEQENLMQGLAETIENMKKQMEKNKNSDGDCKQYLKNAKRIVEIMQSEQDITTKYDEFNALEVLAVQTAVVNKIFEMSKSSKYLESEVGKISNDFYSTIGLCLDAKTLAKNKNIDNLQFGNY